MRLFSIEAFNVYIRQWYRSSLIQLMAYRPFGGKPLPEPMMTDVNFILRFSS